MNSKHLLWILPLALALPLLACEETGTSSADGDTAEFELDQEPTEEADGDTTDAMTCQHDDDCVYGYMCDYRKICVPYDPADGDREAAVEEEEGTSEEDSTLPDGDGEEPADGDEPGETEIETTEVEGDTIVDGDYDVSPQCARLQEGWNEDFVVDSENRSFILNLPNNVQNGGPWPVIFNWHGYGDSAENMAGFLDGWVNDEIYSFILVSPEDTGMQPLSGLDWAILSVDIYNKEARLFDEILTCLVERYPIDEDRIHSVGFSAGAITTDLLAVTRGDYLASIISYSGIYFSNPQNDISFTNWVPLITENTYSQMLVHGGSNDQWGNALFTIHFDQCGLRDVPYLNSNGHDVIHCDHGGGHTIPSNLQARPGLTFLRDHPRGSGTSPYRETGLPDVFPDICELSEATSR